VVALADMTSNQLIRRARILEEVIELIGEVGADAVQMRDVAQRSGVALATVYRYFSSKDHLLAVALEDWQKRLTRRINASGGKTPAQPLPGVIDYIRRALHAFHRNPEMTALMLKTTTSTDPHATSAIDHMNRNNVEMFGRLLDGLAPEDIPFITFGLSAALSGVLAALLTNTLSLDEALARVEWVARALLSDRPARIL
jgi:TetR/AcrR family transcriptional regulator, cholesterol catabolism regulator